MTNVIQASTPPSEQIEAQVARINESKALSGAVVTQALLKHLVTLALAGDEAQLHEKIIGIEMFERQPDYNPAKDNIVRLETEKLRHRLIAYYRLEGVKDPIRIGLRRGEFTPYFGMLESSSPTTNASSGRELESNRRASEPSIELQNGGSGSGSGSDSMAEKGAWAKRLPLLVGVVVGCVAVAFLLPLLKSPAGFFASPAPSIAVLPLVNRSPQKLLEYHVDGFTETLRAGLAATGKVSVSSSAASFAFKNKFSNPRMVSRALGVQRVLQGEFRSTGDKFAVELKLFDTESSEQLWSKKAEGGLADLPAIRQRILGELLAVMSVPVDEKLKARLQSLETTVPAAYDDYLSGLQDSLVTDSGLSTGSAIVLPRAAEHFRRAIRKDPKYLAAHLGLAASLSRLGLVTQRKPEPILAEARRQWEQALALDPDNAEAQAMLGTHLARHEQDYKAGEAHLNEAIRIHPQLATSHAQLAQHILLPQMRWKEAQAAISRAMELDPADPLVLESNAKVLAFQGKTKEAVAAYEKLRSGPHSVYAVARSYVEGGNLKEADAIVTRLMQIVPSPEVQALNCYLLASTGRQEAARQVASQLALARQIAYVAPSAMALVHIALGESAAALTALEAARAEKDSELSLLRVSKLYDSLRGEGRFRQLAANLEKAN